jgi:hypothetical protein
MIETILIDLERHERLFDLSGRLGRELLDIAAEDQCENFDNQRSADGVPWAPLSHKYQEWKDNAYPGMPVGVRTGMLRAALIGPRTQSEGEATMEVGATEDAKQEFAWLSEGDDLNNRPARPSDGLSASAVEQVDITLNVVFINGV